MSSFKPNRFALAEAIAALVLILLYIWLARRTHPLAWTIILALMFASQAVRRETLDHLGLRRANLWTCIELFAPAISLLGLALLAVGTISGTIRPVPFETGFLSLILYCAWGLFQQYLLAAYFVNRLAAFSPERAPLLAGLFFSVAHLPNWFLMIVTLAGGYVGARVYLRFRNVYVLGLAHGVLGFLLYLCVPDTISHHLYVGPKWFS
jgi:hypothetical protein